MRWLLDRVGELQRASDVKSSSSPTLADLEEIAKEAGLDPGLMRQAARELDSAPPIKPNPFVGSPLRFVIERTIAGEATEAAVASILGKVEDSGGGPGFLNSVGRTFNWHSRHGNSGRTMQVRVTVADGVTRIRIEEYFGNLAGGLFGGVLGGVGGGIGLGAGTALGAALHSVVFAIGFPAIIIGTTYVSVRAGFKRYVRNRERVLFQLMDELEGVLRPLTLNES